MRSEDEAKYDLITKVEKKLSRGETTDKAGHRLKLEKDYEPVELEPADEFWLWLAGEMAGAIHPEGSYPVPSEETHVFQRIGIRHPENQTFCRDMLRNYWSGRAEGLSSHFQKPTPTGKSGKGKR